MTPSVLAVDVLVALCILATVVIPTGVTRISLFDALPIFAASALAVAVFFAPLVVNTKVLCFLFAAHTLLECRFVTPAGLAVHVIVTMRGTRAVLVVFYGAGVSFDDALPVFASIR